MAADPIVGPVRVQDAKTGHKFTVAIVAEGQKVLTDVPATDAAGNWLPPEYAESKNKGA